MSKDPNKFLPQMGAMVFIIHHIERFSIECRKTKTKVITLANHKEHRQNYTVNQSKFEVITCS